VSAVGKKCDKLAYQFTGTTSERPFQQGDIYSVNTEFVLTAEMVIYFSSLVMRLINSTHLNVHCLKAFIKASYTFWKL
jgi:hypothetical protein